MAKPCDCYRVSSMVDKEPILWNWMWKQIGKGCVELVSPWVIAWHLREWLQLKVSGCTTWQVNICCVLSTWPFPSAEGIRRGSDSMIVFLFDVVNRYCSQIQLFLLVWYLSWHFKVLRMLKPQINENLKQAMVFAKSSAASDGVLRDALGNLLSW